ncbi:hypothetical protein [Tardibacter chloracetimidivorans]|uniref:hypothetical protein n=1 Tax=Tardibacter chloracetimidivorans TaxID=1921510 RepID=UPI00130191EA|nr:hypothetical protein [Tardibacter chloracetimidivorans]
MLKKLSIAFSLLACSCGGPVVKEKVSVAKVPVVAKCTADRPERPQRLSAAFSDAEWQSLAPRAKASQVAAQGLRWQNYGEQMDAATAGCP